jgi:hypothetical protein
MIDDTVERKGPLKKPRYVNMEISQDVKTWTCLIWQYWVAVYRVKIL